MNRIRELRISAKMTMKQAAEALELPYTTYVNYEKGAREPNSEVLIKIADYYSVSTDYLMGRTLDSFKAPTLNAKDERDVARDLEQMMDNLESADGLMFDGNPMSDEARESMRAAIELGLKTVKLLNKETYTPKKYKKG